MSKRYLPLLAFLALVACAAITGSMFMPGEWYASLNRPSWTPPNWLFAPVWTLLYVMIAVAGWRMWRAEGFGPTLAVWSVGLALNSLWSALMFGAHRIDLAFAESLVLLLSVALFIALAWRRERTAALLFVPYLAWVSFATVLNLAILRLNG